MKPFMTRCIVGSLAGVLFFLAVTIGNSAWKGRQRRTCHEQLVQEFGSIKPPSGSVIRETWDSFNRYQPTPIVVGGKYSSALSEFDTIQYYTQQLASLGWSPVQRAHANGQNREGLVIRFCKGQLSATLDTNLNGRGDYSLELTSGLHNCHTELSRSTRPLSPLALTHI